MGKLTTVFRSKGSFRRDFSFSANFSLAIVKQLNFKKCYDVVAVFFESCFGEYFGNGSDPPHKPKRCPKFTLTSFFLITLYIYKIKNPPAASLLKNV